MNIQAISRGVIIGFVFVGILAVVFALVEFHSQFSLASQHVVLVISLMLVGFVAGGAAGRSTETLGWLHGSLAAITLDLIGMIGAETFFHHANPHVGLNLLLTAITGLVGGLVGAATQY